MTALTTSHLQRRCGSARRQQRLPAFQRRAASITRILRGEAHTFAQAVSGRGLRRMPRNLPVGTPAP